MSARRNDDGTVDVRVVLTVRVDPIAWAEQVMDEHPGEVTSYEVRKDVKKRVRDHVAAAEMGGDDHLPITRVRAEGVYT